MIEVSNILYYEMYKQNEFSSRGLKLSSTSYIEELLIIEKDYEINSLEEVRVCFNKSLVFNMIDRTCNYGIEDTIILLLDNHDGSVEFTKLIINVFKEVQQKSTDTTVLLIIKEILRTLVRQTSSGRFRKKITEEIVTAQELSRSIKYERDVNPFYEEMFNRFKIPYNIKLSEDYMNELGLLQDNKHLNDGDVVFSKYLNQNLIIKDYKFSNDSTEELKLITLPSITKTVNVHVLENEGKMFISKVRVNAGDIIGLSKVEEMDDTLEIAHTEEEVAVAVTSGTFINDPIEVNELCSNSIGLLNCRKDSLVLEKEFKGFYLLDTSYNGEGTQYGNVALVAIEGVDHVFTNGCSNPTFRRFDEDFREQGIEGLSYLETLGLLRIKIGEQEFPEVKRKSTAYLKLLDKLQDLSEHKLKGLEFVLAMLLLEDKLGEPIHIILEEAKTASISINTVGYRNELGINKVYLNSLTQGHVVNGCSDLFAGTNYDGMEMSEALAYSDFGRKEISII